MIETILTRAAELLFNESAVIGFCLGGFPFIFWKVVRLFKECRDEAAQDIDDCDRATFVSKINNRW